MPQAHAPARTAAALALLVLAWSGVVVAWLAVRGVPGPAPEITTRTDVRPDDAAPPMPVAPPVHRSADPGNAPTGRTADARADADTPANAGAVAGRGGQLEVLVLRADDRTPVVGCEVHATPVDALGDDAGPRARATSGDDGAAVLAGLPRGRLRVAAGPDEPTAPHTSARWFGDPTLLDLSPGAERVALTLLVRPTAEVVGRAVDEAGRPVAGAALGLRAENAEFVHESALDARTDDEGRFFVPGVVLRGDRSCVIFADHPAFAERGEAVVEPRAGTDRRIDAGDLVLRGRRASVVGRLTDGAGRALPDATVGATSEAGRRHRTATRADGSFVLDGLEPGAWEIDARPRCLGGDGVHRVTLTAGAGDIDLGALVAADGVHVLRGRVVGTDGHGLAGARVSGPLGEVDTGSDGAFAFAACSREAVSLTVRAEEPGEPRAKIVRRFDDLIPDGAEHRLELRPRGIRFVLDLSDRSGADDGRGPAPAREVRGRGPGSGFRRTFASGPGRLVRIPGPLATGEWIFEVRAAGYEPVELRRVLLDDLSEREFELQVALRAISGG